MLRGIALVSLASAVALTACRTTEPERPLEVFVIDVGAGQSILFRTPDGRTCLVDGGPTYAGANAVCPLLDSLGITELDYTIATNYSAGRVGGLDEVIRHVGGEEGILHRCYDRGRIGITPEFVEYAGIARSRRHRIRPGERVELGELSFRCLASNGQVAGRRAARVTDERDRSIALIASWRGFNLLLPSDLMSIPGAGRLALATDAAEIADDADVLIVPDGGSEASVSWRFQQVASPRVAVLSVAAGDSLRPSPHAISRLARRGRRIYATGRLAPGLIPAGRGRSLGGNVRISVGDRWFAVAGDTYARTD